MGRAVSFRETKGDSFQQIVRRGVVFFESGSESSALPKEL